MYTANSKLIMPTSGEIIRPGEPVPDYIDERLAADWKAKGFIVGFPEKKKPSKTQDSDSENEITEPTAQSDESANRPIEPTAQSEETKEEPAEQVEEPEKPKIGRSSAPKKTVKK